MFYLLVHQFKDPCIESYRYAERVLFRYAANTLLRELISVTE